MSGGGGGGGGGTPAAQVYASNQAPELQLQYLLGTNENPGPALQQYRWAQDMMNQWNAAQSKPTPDNIVNPTATYNPAKVVYNPTTGGYDTVATAAQGGIMSLRG